MVTSMLERHLFGESTQPWAWRHCSVHDRSLYPLHRRRRDVDVDAAMESRHHGQLVESIATHVYGTRCVSADQRKWSHWSIYIDVMVTLHWSRGPRPIARMVSEWVVSSASFRILHRETGELTASTKAYGRVYRLCITERSHRDYNGTNGRAIIDLPRTWFLAHDGSRRSLRGLLATHCEISAMTTLIGRAIGTSTKEQRRRLGYSGIQQNDRRWSAWWRSPVSLRSLEFYSRRFPLHRLRRDPVHCRTYLCLRGKQNRITITDLTDLN